MTVVKAVTLHHIHSYIMYFEQALVKQTKHSKYYETAGVTNCTCTYPKCRCLLMRLHDKIDFDDL